MSKVERKSSSKVKKLAAPTSIGGVRLKELEMGGLIFKGGANGKRSVRWMARVIESDDPRVSLTVCVDDPDDAIQMTTNRKTYYECVAVMLFTLKENKIPFTMPEQPVLGRYYLLDLAHARNALVLVSQAPVKDQKIMYAAVAKKFPELAPCCKLAKGRRS